MVMFDFDGDNYWRKKAWHDKYDLLFHKIAKALGLKQSEYDIRHIQGSDWVLGDIIFQTAKLYVSVSGNGSDAEDGSFMFRACKSMTDFKGGRTHWLQLARLHDPELIIREFKIVMMESEYLT